MIATSILDVIPQRVYVSASGRKLKCNYTAELAAAFAAWSGGRNEYSDEGLIDEYSR